MQTQKELLLNPVVYSILFQDLQKNKKECFSYRTGTLVDIQFDGKPRV